MHWGIILIKMMMNKEERKAYNKQYNLDNKEKISERKKVSDKQYNLDNKEKKKQYNKKWNQDNKEYRKQYRLDNKERIKEYKKEWNKQWYQNNKEQILEQRNQYRKERYYSDPVFKFKRICRCRTLQAFKQKSWKKNGGTEKLLGCDWKTAMNHIESQFVDDKKWMNWDNHGEWEIDHIIPLGKANTKEEMNPLFNYKNLQPLLAEDNRRKGDRIL
jgi:hypothetical protein